MTLDACGETVHPLTYHTDETLAGVRCCGLHANTSLQCRSTGFAGGQDLEPGYTDHIWWAGPTDNGNAGCLINVTNAEAIIACAAVGLRLCYAAEAPACCGTGCDHDRNAIWVDFPVEPYFSGQAGAADSIQHLAEATTRLVDALAASSHAGDDDGTPSEEEGEGDSATDTTAAPTGGNNEVGEGGGEGEAAAPATTPKYQVRPYVGDGHIQGPWALVLQYGYAPYYPTNGYYGLPDLSVDGFAKLADADINAIPNGGGEYTYYMLTSGESGACPEEATSSDRRRRREIRLCGKTNDLLIRQLANQTYDDLLPLPFVGGEVCDEIGENLRYEKLECASWSQPWQNTVQQPSSRDYVLQDLSTEGSPYDHICGGWIVRSTVNAYRLLDESGFRYYGNNKLCRYETEEGGPQRRRRGNYEYNIFPTPTSEIARWKVKVWKLTAE